MELRQQKGMQIAKGKTIKPTKNGWFVKSQTSDNCYKVNEEFVCTCPDSACRGVTCKHAYAVRYYLEVEKETKEGIEKERIPLTHTQAWKAYNEAQTHGIRLFDKLLVDLVKEIDEPPQTRGRPRLSLREQVFCAIQKVYSHLSSRRARSLFLNSFDRKEIGKAPNYNAINKLLNREDLTPILHKLISISTNPLKSVETDFAVDSSGFRTGCYSTYAQEKYLLKRRHEWVKAHIISGVKTNIVTAVNITDGNSGDSPEFKPLVKDTSENGFSINEVSADKAYSSKKNYEAVRKVGGQAYLPFKSNATGKARGSLLWKKMFHYFHFKQEEFMEHYHKRSNIESMFGAVKKKFGESLKSKNRVAQENELLCKFIAYNLTVVIQEMFELGIKADFGKTS